MSPPPPPAPPPGTSRHCSKANLLFLHLCLYAGFFCRAPSPSLLANPDKPWDWGLGNMKNAWFGDCGIYRAACDFLQSSKHKAKLFPEYFFLQWEYFGGMAWAREVSDCVEILCLIEWTINVSLMDEPITASQQNWNWIGKRIWLVLKAFCMFFRKY